MKKTVKQKTKPKRATTRKLKMIRPRQTYAVTEGIYIQQKGFRANPKKVIPGVERMDYEDVKPALTEQNWNQVGAFKWERTGGYLGDWYTDMPRGHWMRKVYPFPGIYRNKEFPDDLVRVMGDSLGPEFYVVFFKKK